MRYYQAQDTFVAALDDGTEKLISKRDALPESHELVKRDLAASKADKGRVALFRAMDEDEPPPSSVPAKDRAPRGKA